MSYDLAAWAGPTPASNAEASAEYQRRMDAMEAALAAPSGPPPASPEIRGFVDAALARYPELDDESGHECPWASTPSLGEAVGDLIYFPMTFSGAEYARDVIAEIAGSLGLVCYDPQIEQLLPDRNAVSASTIAACADAALARHFQAQETTTRVGGWWTRLFKRN